MVNKITPRIMSKTPSWIVSFKPDVLNEVNRLDNVEERIEENRPAKDNVSSSPRLPITYLW